MTKEAISRENSTHKRILRMTSIHTKFSSTSEDDVGLLSVIIDCNPIIWSKYSDSPNALSLLRAIEQLLVFINAYLSLKHDNQLSVIATFSKKSYFIYPNQDSKSNQKKECNIFKAQAANAYQHFLLVDDAITSEIKRLIVEETTGPIPENDGCCQISSALTQALCYIHRIKKTDPMDKLRPRILILSVSPDSSTQYIQIMNNIFYAQKSSLPIDVCKLYNEESAFLKQASDISGGTFVKVTKPDSLIQYLMFTFLADQHTRNIFCLPEQTDIDFRAACFCHKKIVEIGYVCSVCLSIFCSFSPICSTCGSKFEFRKLQ